MIKSHKEIQTFLFLVSKFSCNNIYEVLNFVLLNPVDLIPADIEDQMPSGVHIEIPPFLVNKTHFTWKESELCYKIARHRMHVEREKEDFKKYQMLNHIPANYQPLSTKIMQLCACLVNLQAPLLKEIV